MAKTTTIAEAPKVLTDKQRALVVIDGINAGIEKAVFSKDNSITSRKNAAKLIVAEIKLQGITTADLAIRWIQGKGGVVLSDKQRTYLSSMFRPALTITKVSSVSYDDVKNALGKLSLTAKQKAEIRSLLK